MPRLTWDKVGERFFETGVDHGVLFPMKNNGTYDNGVNWDGLTSVDESPEGGEANDIYADNIKYLSLMSAEQYKATIGAYQSPEEFDACDGSAALATGVSIGQQSRKGFGFSYRSKLGNDTEGDDYGYKIHLIYNAKCAPSQKSRSTVNDSPEATELSWEVSTTPVNISAINPDTGKPYKPTAHLWIDSTKTDAAKLAAFEDILYGTDGEDTYVAATATADSYSAVTPEGTENPSTVGWYELDGSSYALSGDTTVDSSKTYYDRTVGDNPSAEGWYELGGAAYILSTDASVVSGKTYYKRTAAAGTESTLPSPDEVFAFFNS